MTGDGPSPQRRSAPRVRVIGVDPGKTTGLVYFVDGEIASAVAVALVEVEDVLRLWLATEERVTVAIERFVITARTGKKTQQTDALKVSGIVENLVLRADHHVLVYQNMSDAKKLGSPKIQRALGWRRTGKNAQHMNDATSQVLKALADHHLSAFLQVITPDII